MDNYILQPSQNIKVTDSYDVAVCGGGFAGVAAALAAKRNGADRVLLIERQYGLGGLGTLGLVTVYLPLCDGMGNQIIRGIGEELFKLSIRYGWEGLYPDAWLENKGIEERKKQRYQAQYNANLCAILMEQLLIEEGIEILYGTMVCDCAKSENKITHLFLENKSGRSAIKVKSVVDTTGDADIFVQAGAKTTLFNQKNILAAWYYFSNNGINKLKTLGFSDTPEKYKAVNTYDEQKRYQGIDAKELTQMTLDSHTALLKDFLSKGKLTEFYSLNSIASIPQVRMTRRIEGECVLDDTPFEKYYDCVGVISNWKQKGPIYQIPFGCLYSREVDNLITAGRSISVTDAMWDITRVIPCCAVTGEAAGTAAAISDDFKNINIKQFQSILTKNGVALDI